MRRFSTILLVAMTAALPAAAAPRHGTTPGRKAPAGMHGLPAVPKGDNLAVVQTDKGTIYLDLYTRVTPITAGNFVKLSRKGFYDGVAFHRVVPGFVIQAGDPYSKKPGDPRVGSGGPGYTIKREASAMQFKHDPGVLAMARTQDPDSAGSQWYITLGPAHFLDGQYAVFGKVLKGQDVAAKIQQGDKIKQITIH